MDNFFFSPELFQQMLLTKIYCCGTVRLNRKGMPEAIKGMPEDIKGMPEAIKAAKLKIWGETITMQKGNLVATAWKDKKKW